MKSSIRRNAAAVAICLAMAGLATPALSAVGQSEAAKMVAQTFDVQVLRVRAGQLGGRGVWLITVMNRGGDFNTAFQVNTLAVDQGVHPSARKFNAGQKVIFWLVILGGLSLSLSGLSLLFPFSMPLFDATYSLLGLGAVTPIEEMQLAQLWHAIVGLVLIVAIIAHIYIGSLGMEGAFDAMGSGQVDENWAREHHNIWVAEAKGETRPAE